MFTFIIMLPYIVGLSVLIFLIYFYTKMLPRHARELKRMYPEQYAKMRTPLWFNIALLVYCLLVVALAIKFLIKGDITVANLIIDVFMLSTAMAVFYIVRRHEKKNNILSEQGMSNSMKPHLERLYGLYFISFILLAIYLAKYLLSL